MVTTTPRTFRSVIGIVGLTGRDRAGFTRRTVISILATLGITSLWLAPVIPVASAASAAAESQGEWESVLAQMPFPDGVALTRSNAIRLLVGGLQSNQVVKALVILPGVVDDFHLIHRDATPAVLAENPRNLAGALAAINRATPVQVLFRDGMLLLWTTTDQPAIEASTRNAATLESSLAATRSGSRPAAPISVRWVDQHWKSVHSDLAKAVRRTVRPGGDSPESWHFERLNIVAFGLNEFEMIRAVTLASGTQVALEPRALRFEHAGQRKP